MTHFQYRRHFSLLAAAVLVAFLLKHGELFGDALVVTFAVNGALHASALVLALSSPQSLARRCAFVALAAILSVFTLYVAILAFEVTAVLPSGERLYLALGSCSAVGAITYGTLVRIFWLSKLSPRSILAMAVVCVLATLLAFFARSFVPFLEGWWIAAAWWFAFSLALKHFDARGAGNPDARGAGNPDARGAATP